MSSPARISPRPVTHVDPATSYAVGLLKAVAAITLALAVTTASAADYYWDANGASAGTGGSGTWTTANTWRLGSAVGTLGNWPGATNNAFMEGTAGTLTLSSSVTMGTTGTAFFNVTNYTLAPESNTTRQLTGSIVVGSGLNLNINATGSTGNQTLTIFGNVTGGTVTLRGAPTAANASRLNIAASGTLSSPVTINTTGVGNAGIVGLSTGAVVSGAIINSSTGNRTMIGATSGNDLTLTSSAIISGSTGLQFAAGSSGGTGVITLQSQSTYTGTTEFNAGNNGVIRLGVNNALPTTTDVVWAFSNANGGIFDLNGFNQEFASLAKAATTGTGSIRNNGGGTSVLTIGGATTGTAAFSIPIVNNTSGTGTVAIERAGTGSLTLSASNSYSGGTRVTSGTLIVGNVFALGTSTGSLTADGGTLNLSGFSIGVGTLSGSAGTITSLASGTLTTTSNANSTFGGSLTGSAALTKAGTGLLSLTGSSSYTGPTLVNAGTLAVNGVIGSGSLSVAAVAWLQGTGTIGGPVDVAGTLSPGNSPGVLTLSSVSLGAASNTVIEITGLVRGTDYDGINVTTASGLTYGGTLSLSFGSLLGSATLDIFSFTGGSFGDYTSVVSTGSYAGTWSPLGGGQFQLLSGAQTLTFSEATGDIIIVPEPATLALAGFGVAAASWARRRCRRAKAA
jgi:autotransporter-associated beta strand protein